MTIIIATIVLFLWTIYRLLFPENLILDELVIKPIIWLLPVLLIVKFDFYSLGFKSKIKIKSIIFGLLFGLVLSISRILTNDFNFVFSLPIIISALFTALTEEIFFRGYLLTRWLKCFKKPIFALMLNGLFFTFTHLPIAVFVFHYSGYQLMSYLLLNFISGFIDILLFFQTGSIYSSIANHFVWNTFSGLYR